VTHAHSAGGSAHVRRLQIALVLTATFMVIQAVAGFLSGSLVLVADSGHMLADVVALSLALFAIWFGRRPANPAKTYGYYRVEILAALTNAALLFAISGYILYEAYQRFTSPTDVPGLPLIIVASVGLLVNIAAASALYAGASENLNVRGAFLETLSDVLGSVGAVVAGLLIVTTGWRYADPLFATAIGLFILPRTWKLMRESIDVLLEGTPRGLDVSAVQDCILAVDNVLSVHDLHIWTVTSGFVALSGHVTVSELANRDRVLTAVQAGLRDDFGIEHVTVQVETAQLEQALGQPCLPGSAAGCYATADEYHAPHEAGAHSIPRA
jgi:cobalt-zinc-cadmium efflux system protein